MYRYQEDIDLLEKLDQKRNNICHYCNGISKYTQPDTSGDIVNVCDNHFNLKYW